MLALEGHQDEVSFDEASQGYYRPMRTKALSLVSVGKCASVLAARVLVVDRS